MARNTVRWYGDEVLVEIGERLDKTLVEIGLQTVAEAQVMITNNGQVDTGFMRLTGYVHGSDGTSTYNETANSRPDRRRAPERQAESDHEVVVAFAAEYALYQEARRSFLYAALSKVGRDLETVFEEVFDD